MKRGFCFLFAFTLAGSLCMAAPRSPVTTGRVCSETIVDNATIISLQAPVFTIPDTGKINMVLIPAGNFAMGSPENEAGRQPDERQHEVTISKPFYMGETEICQKQFLDLMHPDFKPIFARIGPWGHSLPEIHQGGPWKAQGKYHRDPSNDPMENVTWMQAMAFCNKLNAAEKKACRLPFGYAYRLPTEAEWEYACRAGTTGPFNNPRVEEIVKRKVGAGPNVFANNEVNRFGLFRMHMGVFEWCLDDYGPYPVTNVDPVVFVNGDRKVARGGDDGYFEHPTSKRVLLEDEAEVRRYVRSASRAHFSPGVPYPIIGFRPVLAPMIEVPRPVIPDELLIEPIPASKN